MACIVPGCRSRKPYKKLYSLPRTDIIRELWMEYLVPLKPSLKNLPREQLNTYQVCVLHFESKYLENGIRKYRCAPTLSTPEEIKTGVPTRPLPCLILAREDHTYCKEQNKELAASLNDHNYYIRREPPQYATTLNALDGSNEVEEIPRLARQLHQKEYPGIVLDEPDDQVPEADETTEPYDGFSSDDDQDDNDADHSLDSEHGLDEVDTLFISYAASFRKLSANLQRMLKLDLAKLFARYEMKNLILEESCDKENDCNNKLVNKSLNKKATKGFVNQSKSIFNLPETKIKPSLKRPAPPLCLKDTGPTTSRDDVTSAGNPKSALSKFLKFPKYQPQCNSNQTQARSPSHSISSEFHDNPRGPLRISPLLDAEKYSSDWEQVSDDDPIVEKFMLPWNWSAKDVIIISKDDVPG